MSLIHCQTDEKAFAMIGPNAPQDVKDAWMEAAKEVNANGLGIKGWITR